MSFPFIFTIKIRGLILDLVFCPIWHFYFLTHICLWKFFKSVFDPLQAVTVISKWYFDSFLITLFSCFLFGCIIALIPLLSRVLRTKSAYTHTSASLPCSVITFCYALDNSPLKAVVIDNQKTKQKIKLSLYIFKTASLYNPCTHSLILYLLLTYILLGREPDERL